MQSFEHKRSQAKTNGIAEQRLRNVLPPPHTKFNMYEYKREDPHQHNWENLDFVHVSSSTNETEFQLGTENVKKVHNFMADVFIGHNNATLYCSIERWRGSIKLIPWMGHYGKKKNNNLKVGILLTEWRSSESRCTLLRMIERKSKFINTEHYIRSTLHSRRSTLHQWHSPTLR